MNRTIPGFEAPRWIEYVIILEGLEPQHGEGENMATKRIRFIPVKNGDLMDIGDLGIVGVSGKNKYLGFKPAPGRKLAGWIVVALDEEDKRLRPVKRKQPRT